MANLDPQIAHDLHFDAPYFDRLGGTETVEIFEIVQVWSRTPSIACSLRRLHVSWSKCLCQAVV
jgi:hypothetical protein